MRRTCASLQAMEIEMMTRWKTALVALPAVLLALPALAESSGEWSGAWHHGWDLGWGHALLGFLMMILFWGGVVAVIVLAVRWFGSGPSHQLAPAPARNKALDILHERYAGGAIDEDEFENRKRRLSD